MKKAVPRVYSGWEKRMEDLVGKKFVFRGRVQGVGFRYTARALARGFEVDGFVRNMPDGSVVLLAEGAGKEVDRFIDALKARMADCIRDCEEMRVEPVRRHGGFEIAF